MSFHLKKNKQMKNVRFFCIFCILALSTNAQIETSIGIKGGLSIPKIKATGDNPMSKGYASRLAGGASVFAEFKFNSWFSLQPVIEYSGQGGVRDGMQPIPARVMAEKMSSANIPAVFLKMLPQDPYIYADFSSKTKFDYLMIPVLAKFGHDFGQSFRAYISVGPFISFLMKAEQITSGNSSIYLDVNGNIMSVDDILAQTGLPIRIGEKPFDSKSDIKSDMNPINAGIEGNLGVTYKLGRHSIFLEGGGNYGFIKLQKNPENGENTIGAGSIMLGYAFRL